jgi:hypothetical protein
MCNLYSVAKGLADAAVDEYMRGNGTGAPVRATSLVDALSVVPEEWDRDYEIIVKGKRSACRQAGRRKLPAARGVQRPHARQTAAA